LRSVALLIGPVRRVLVSFDSSGNALLISDARRGDNPLTVEVNLRRDSATVVGGPRQGQAAWALYRGAASDVLADPGLGNLGALADYVRLRCLSALTAR
jgi:hypothetical protein